jgi:hypothetical protein
VVQALPPPLVLLVLVLLLLVLLLLLWRCWGRNVDSESATSSFS